MTIDELYALLDKKNPWAESLECTFKVLHKSARLVAERKGSDLVEVVQQLKQRGLYPIVDKKLGLVLGTSSGHALLRQELFRYHYHANDPELNLPYIDVHESEERYLSDKHGYFISSMRPNVIVTGFGYRPDRFDKDLFLVHDFATY